MTDSIYCAIIFNLLFNTNYNKYYSYINKDLNNNKLLKKLFLCVEKLHTTNPVNHTVDELELLFTTEYPILSKDEKLLLPQLLGSIRTVTVADDTVMMDYLQALKDRQIGERLAIAALDFSQGRVDKSDLETLSQELFTKIVKLENESLYSVCDLDQAVAFVGARGIRWRLRSLNQALGSLRKGNFGFIFARPECGKTTFLASEVSNFVPQLEGRPVLWVNNEEPIPQIMMRCYQAALGKPRDWIVANLEEAKAIYAATIGNSIKFVDTGNANKKSVERICKELQPGLIVFDQLDKVNGFEAERYDLLQKAKYQWARELAKLYGPVIGVCQAGGTAENKRYLDMNDVDSSHTAKQGEADWVLGIGMSHNDNEQFKRYFSICKNKLPGDEDSVPEMRHAKMEVGINPYIARYEG